MFKFGCSVCNKTWGIGETRTCTCAPEDDDDIQQYKKPWVGLTDDEIKEASLKAGMQEHYMGFHSGFIRFAQTIEAKLKEKNT